MPRIAFDESLPCPLPAGELHARLLEALRDTDRSTFWPRRLNRVVIDLWEPNALFHATYRVAGLPGRRMAYRIAELRPGSGFTYAPGPGHPFRGAIHVDVEQSADGSTLRWRGTYDAAIWRPERLFFAWFAPRFFEGLREGLAGLRPGDGT